jgi:hypothetical protein
MLSQLLGDKNEQTEVETSVIKVRGKTLVFNNTIYSIPNLSLVEIGEVKRSLPPLFVGSAFMALIGLIIGGDLFFLFWIGGIGAVITFMHYLTNKKYGLHLVTNSGFSTLIVSPDEDFLKIIVLTLYNLINHPDAVQNLNIHLDQRKIIEVESMQNAQLFTGNIQGDVVNNV